MKPLLNTYTIRYITIDMSTNPKEILTISNHLISQKIFFGDQSASHQLLVIKFNQFTIFCIFYNDEELSNQEKIISSINQLKSDLNEILTLLEETSRRKIPIIDNAAKNIYFNRMNMANSSTIDWNRDITSDAQSIIMRTLAEDMQWLHQSGEMIVKRENDPWIVAKRSDMRELLVMINQKNATLKEIRDKLKQILSTQFNSIFLLE